MTDTIPAIAIARDHKNWPIAEKIARKLEEGPRQILGLTQKGAARDNPEAARAFVGALLSSGIAERVPGRPSLMRPTADGRGVLRAFWDNTELPTAFYEFFEIS